MKLTIETDLYNERRYGKPYVGVVSSLDGNVVRWGTWIGTPGSVGMLEIEVEPGEIVMHGQKDNRGNNGAPRYAIVSDEGALEYMGKAAAVNKARAIEKARAALASTAQPPAPAAQGDALDSDRLNWLEANAQITIERSRFIGSEKHVYEVASNDEIYGEGDTLRTAIDAAIAAARAAKEGGQP